MQMAGYTKLFNSILHSTIWSEPNETRILWITMLAMADKEGKVNASIPGLARMAGITVEQTQAGLERFLSPDEFSRTPEHEGRRIESIQGGWFLLNHPKYRALMSLEERKEYNRLRQQEHRKKVKQGCDVSMTVNDNNQSTHIAEADSKAKAVPPPTASPSAKERGDVLPTAPEALAISELFGRKSQTAWSPKEITKYRDLIRRQVATLESIATIADYYRAEREKGPEGRHRRDLSTFLNNFDGELDRATAFTPKGGKPELWRKDWEPWLTEKGHDVAKYRDYQFAPDFLKTDFWRGRKK